MNKQPSFLKLCSREICDITKDVWVFSALSWIMPLAAILLWLVFSRGLANDLPLGVVDLDKSKLSRSLIKAYEASPALKVYDNYLSPDQGFADLRNGKIYGFVIIPHDLQKNATLGLPPTVTAFINSQYLLIGKIINSNIFQAHGTLVTTVETNRALATKSPVPSQNLNSAIPVGNQFTPLFNISRNYAQFLVSAIIPAFWQILIVAGTILSMAQTRRKYSLSGWLGNIPGNAITAKIMVLAIIFTLHGFCILGFMYGLLGWSMRGDWTILLFSQALTATISVTIGCLYFLVQPDPARSLSLATAYVAPSLAFMGITFPVTDMPLLAQIWRNLIPVSHYIEIQVAVANYGAPMSRILEPLEKLLYFLPIFFCCWLMARKRSSIPKVPHPAAPKTKKNPV